MQPRSVLDRPLARLTALGIFALIALALLWPDWEGLFTYGARGDQPANRQLTECLDKRLGDVRDMLADGTISEAQAEQFRTRAENYCQSRFGG
jgi:hypothetical protein